jgi:hypothetical protein
VVTKHAGVGLGLSLVATIIKLHCFQLVIHSGPGVRVANVCPDNQGEKPQWTPALVQAASPAPKRAS